MDLTKITELLKILSNFEKLNTSQPQQSNSEYDFFVGKYVIVRHDYCGVNSGFVKSFNNENIVLEKSRKLWRWNIKDVGVCLEDLAILGLNPDYSKSKISAEVDVLIIPNNQYMCSVILASDKSRESIINAPIAHQD